jgi:hypothetical protein
MQGAELSGGPPRAGVPEPAQRGRRGQEQPFPGPFGFRGLAVFRGTVFGGTVFGAGTGVPYRDGCREPPPVPLSRPPRLISWDTMTFRWISLVPSPTIISGASRKYRSTSNSVE